MRLSIFIFLLLVCAQVHSQSYLHSHSNRRAIWNNYTKEWDYDPPSFADITFTMQGGVIIVNDQASSTYTTGKMVINKTDADPKQFGWEAIDEKYRKCLFKFEKYDDGELDVIIMYDDVLYRYVIDTDTSSGLDKLNN